MGLTTIIIVLTNVILSRGRPEIGPVFDPQLYEHDGFHNNSLGRSIYNPWACNYRLEPGYKCLSCNRALHCYVNNFALLVQCGGLFPYCRSGFCSLRKDEGCHEDAPNKPATVHASGHDALSDASDASSDASANEPSHTVTVVNEVTTDSNTLTTTVESTKL